MGLTLQGATKKGLCVLGTWPSYMIDTKVTFNRVMSWINYVYDIHGELYWGTNAADKQYMTPGNSSWKNQWLAGGNGDGSLTYPGRSNEIGGFTFIPIASLRLKAIRDGLEDLEYMYMLEALSPAGRKRRFNIGQESGESCVFV